MAYDGNGNFVRIHNWTQDAANGIDITASEMDAEDNGFAAGLSKAVTRDGQGKMAADFLPSVGGTFNLGNAAVPWANVQANNLNGSPISSLPVTQIAIGAILSPQTSVEAATGAGITPVNLYIQSHALAGVFYVDRYGTNSTPGTTDMTTAINNAIAVASQNGGGIVQFLAASYLFTATLTVPDNVTLRGMGQMETTLLPTGTFNGITVHGTNSVFGTGRRVIGFNINGAGLTGNAIDILFCGLRCYFADLYIYNTNGIGIKISGSFDHVYERIECRSNASFGIQCYESQAAFDGTYYEQSYLRFIDVTSVTNMSGTELDFAAITGTFQIGETVTQATSGASGKVIYYDFANLKIYVNTVTGTFNTANLVTGATSGAHGTPTYQSGSTAQYLVQWDCAGGDNFYFVSVKPTSGLIGLDFSRSCFSHRIGQLMFDSPGGNLGIAVRCLKFAIGSVFLLDIEKVYAYEGAIGVQFIGGSTVNVETVIAYGSGTPIVVAAGAPGPIFIKSPRIAFTDANSPQVTYPAENIGTYSPNLLGTGASLGNGVLTGEYYQHGNKVSLRILFAMGSTTTFPTSGLGFTLPLAVKTAETQLGQALAFHSASSTNYSLICTLANSAVAFPLSGSAGSWTSTVPFTWATNDNLIITAEYEVT